MATDFNPLLKESSSSSKSKIPLNNVTLSLISSDASSNKGRFMGVEPKIDITESSDLTTCRDLSTLQFQLIFKYVHNERWHKSVLCCARLLLK